MWVCLEGVDGGLRTSLGGRLVRALRAEGRRVLHLREAATASLPAESLAGALRDPRHAALSDTAELMLGCARERQLYDELAAPALARGEIVVADRSVFTHLALACAGRGVPVARALPLVEEAAAGAWPDLVVLADLEPWRARALRRCLHPGEGGPGLRRRLAGEGLAVRMREALLAMARRDARRWLVLSRAEQGVEQMAERALAAVHARLPAGAGRSRAPSRRALEVPSRAASAGGARGAAPVELSGLRPAFFAALERLAPADPAAAVALCAGLPLPEADALRERYALLLPEWVAGSLAGVDTPGAWRLRRALRRRAPAMVARSLCGLGPRGAEQAEALREALADEAPAEVARSLRGVPGRAAAALRERLARAAPGPVLRSLARLEDERAWALRDRLGSEPERAGALLEGLAGLGGLRAWALRRRLGALCPVELVRSLEGLAVEEARALRERWAARAPVAVLASLGRLDDAHARALRARLLARVPEALDGLKGADTPAAWRLREAGLRRWPESAVLSLGALAHGPAGQAFLRRALRGGADPGLQRAALLCLHLPVAVAAAADGRARPVG